MSAMSVAEFVLWAALAFLFWSKGLHRRFPAMGYYLALRAISTPVLMLVLYVESRPWGRGHHIGANLLFWFFCDLSRERDAAVLHLH